MSDQNPVLLTAAIAGNGHMLACYSSCGRLTKLFWPHIDFGQHLGIFLAGFTPLNSHTRWLGENNCRNQHYLPSSNVLQTTFNDGEWEIEQYSYVLPSNDILVNKYRVSNNGENPGKAKFINYFAFRISETDKFDSMYMDFETISMVQYRRNVFLAVGALDVELAGYQCGRVNTSSDPFGAASGGTLWGGQINLGRSAGALAWTLGQIAPGETGYITTYIAAADSAEKIKESILRFKESAPETSMDRTVKHWQGWLERGQHPAISSDGNPEAEKLYRQSLLAIKTMQDDSGGFIAAPEFDPSYQASGGYGYCWLRDALYSAMAMDEAGYAGEAQKFYFYAASIQNKEGDWEQRYFMNGNWAPTWGKQIDQTGSVLFGYLHHYLLRHDIEFAKKIWESTRLAANYLCRNMGENNLPMPSIDPWEERFSQGTYSAAAVFGGLKSAAALAIALKENLDARKWNDAAAELKEAIIKLQWSDTNQRFFRGINKRIDQNEYHYLRDTGQRVWEDKDPSGMYTTYWTAADDNIDSSLLALGFPFNVLPPGNEKLAATARAIEEKLWNHQVGGLHRYDGDCYAGGNPWIITTLFLALYYLREGKPKRTKELLDWCRRQANHNLLLPEQVHRESGGPAWVMPLKWSHAMFAITQLALNGHASWLNMY